MNDLMENAEASVLKTEIVMLNTNKGWVCNGYVEIGYQYRGCNLASIGEHIKLYGDSPADLAPQMMAQFMSIVNDQKIIKELYDASKASKADTNKIATV